mmetsp:Transcript_23086/g.46982  ORF Transcript_23086/g.46982 Transcript_23086/m.46982 type:complete len:226 (+) Transcript_23086:157-834(+)
MSSSLSLPSPKSKSDPLIMLKPCPSIPGMFLSDAIRSSVSLSFLVFGLNCSFLRTLPSGHAGVLPFLHTPAILVHTRCATVPADFPSRAAPSKYSASSSMLSTTPTHAFSMVRHSRLQWPPTVSPLTWFSSLSAAPRLTMSYSAIHAPSLDSESQIAPTRSSTEASSPPRSLEWSNRRFFSAFGASAATSSFTWARALAAMSSHVWHLMYGMSLFSGAGLGFLGI